MNILVALGLIWILILGLACMGYVVWGSQWALRLSKLMVALTVLVIFICFVVLTIKEIL